MAEVKKWTITFSNGYCGYEVEEEFEGTYKEAVKFADDYLPDYAENYACNIFGWGEEILEEEYHAYLADCSYEIEESEED